MDKEITRRDFLATVTAAGAVSLLGLPGRVTAAPGIKIGVFSKHLQWLNARETADITADMGWDGIECPVRPGGHILPEQVHDGLPAMIDALEQKQLEFLIAATGFDSVDAPGALDVLQALAKNNVKLYRPWWFKYNNQTPVPERLQQVKSKFTAMAKVNAELGLCTAYQNHSGGDYVGGAVWDLYDLIRDMDPDTMGSCFDIGHATVEGGYMWNVHARLMLPRIKCIIIKDFTWKQRNGRWQAVWCPLGEGMVNRSFFDLLREFGYTGAIIQHFEYQVEGRTEKQERDNMLQAMQKDCKTLQAWLSDTGLR